MTALSCDGLTIPGGRAFPVARKSGSPRISVTASTAVGCFKAVSQLYGVYSIKGAWGSGELELRSRRHVIPRNPDKKHTAQLINRNTESCMHPEHPCAETNRRPAPCIVRTVSQLVKAGISVVFEVGANVGQAFFEGFRLGHEQPHDKPSVRKAVPCRAYTFLC